jgi:hypothetical protein
MSRFGTHVSSLLLLLISVAAGFACSSSSPATVDGGVGVVTGAIDNHCSAVEPIVVKQSSCTLSPDAGTPSESDAGASDDAAPEPEAAINYNAEADDDDCKYHVKFSSTPVLTNQNVTFDVTLTKLAENNAPAVNADLVIAGVLANDDFHPIPNSGQKATETPAGSGKYVVGPVKFDASGRWKITFHFYETCFDLAEDSPHGHATFFYDVP